MLERFKESGHLPVEVLREEIKIAKDISESKEFCDIEIYYKKHFATTEICNYNVTVGDYFYGYCQLLVDRFEDVIDLLDSDLKLTEYFRPNVIERPIPVSRERISMLGNEMSTEEKLQLALHDIQWCSRIFFELMMIKKLSQFVL